MFPEHVITAHLLIVDQLHRLVSLVKAAQAVQAPSLGIQVGVFRFAVLFNNKGIEYKLVALLDFCYRTVDFYKRIAVIIQHRGKLMRRKILLLQQEIEMAERFIVALEAFQIHSHGKAHPVIGGVLCKERFKHDLGPAAIIEGTGFLCRICAHVLFEIQSFTDERPRINVEHLQILDLRFILQLDQIRRIDNTRKGLPRFPEFHERIEQGESLVVLVGKRIHRSKQHSRISVRYGIGLFGVLDRFGIILFARKNVHKPKVSAVCIFRLALQLIDGLQQMHLCTIAHVDVIFVLADKTQDGRRLNAIFKVLLPRKRIGAISRQ